MKDHLIKNDTASNSYIREVNRVKKLVDAMLDGDPNVDIQRLPALCTALEGLGHKVKRHRKRGREVKATFIRYYKAKHKRKHKRKKKNDREKFDETNRTHCPDLSHIDLDVMYDVGITFISSAAIAAAHCLNLCVSADGAHQRRPAGPGTYYEVGRNSSISLFNSYDVLFSSVPLTISCLVLCLLSCGCGSATGGRVRCESPKRRPVFFRADWL